MVPWEPIDASAMREVMDQSSGWSKVNDDGDGVICGGGSRSTGDSSVEGTY